VGTTARNDSLLPTERSDDLARVYSLAPKSQNKPKRAKTVVGSMFERASNRDGGLA